MQPRHIAIIMDGNGRWANKRFMPRIEGHRVGVKAVRSAIDFCVNQKIEVLTLFSLSVENFLNRPPAEAKFLINLFSGSMIKNADEMHAQNIRIRLIGDLSIFPPEEYEAIRQVEIMTQNNTGLTLVFAVNYSGRWDVLQAAQKMSRYVADKQIDPQTMTEKDFNSFLCLSDLPEPDLLIRTGGDQRISNFMLWQFAYTELFFTEAYWPDFDHALFESAIANFKKRERRFGKVLSENNH